MDVDRFDALTRSFAQDSSRRRAVHLLTGSLISGALGLVLYRVEDTAAHNARKKCKKIEDRDKRRACRRRARRHDRNHANQRCVPACAAGQECLANGSCATPCTESTVCPGGCFCGDAGTEGSRFCVISNTTCDAHTSCETTADCKQGEYCGPCEGTRCLSLCPF